MISFKEFLSEARRNPNDNPRVSVYDKLKQFSIFILTDIVKKLKTTPPKIEKTQQSKLKENNK